MTKPNTTPKVVELIAITTLSKSPYAISRLNVGGTKPDSMDTALPQAFERLSQAGSTMNRASAKIIPVAVTADTFPKRETDQPGVAGFLAVGYNWDFVLSLECSTSVFCTQNEINSRATSRTIMTIMIPAARG